MSKTNGNGHKANGNGNGKPAPVKVIKGKAKPGRPKVAIDWTLVGKYAEAGSSGLGIAAVIGIDEHTLRVRCVTDNKCRLTEFLQAKRAKGDESLRDKQQEVAMAGNVTMLIWLGKNKLGQSDKQEITTDPRITELKGLIQKRAAEKSITYDQELQNYLGLFAESLAPEIKTKLTSDLVQ